MGADMLPSMPLHVLHRAEATVDRCTYVPTQSTAWSKVPTAPLVTYVSLPLVVVACSCRHNRYCRTCVQVRGSMVGKNLVGQWTEPGGAGGGYNYGGFSIRLQANGAFFLGVYWYAAEPTVYYPWEESRTGSALPSSQQCWASDLGASQCA